MRRHRIEGQCWGEADAFYQGMLSSNLDDISVILTSWLGSCGPDQEEHDLVSIWLFGWQGSDIHWRWFLKGMEEMSLKRYSDIPQKSRTSSDLDRHPGNQNEKDTRSGPFLPSCSRSEDFLQFRCPNRNGERLTVSIWVVPELGCNPRPGVAPPAPCAYLNNKETNSQPRHCRLCPAQLRGPHSHGNLVLANQGLIFILISSLKYKHSEKQS